LKLVAIRQLIFVKMPREAERLEVLTGIGYGDKRLSYAELVDPFNKSRTYLQVDRLENFAKV
jgi:hypothetical protein